ncbi:MAG: sigma-70 family RNA polymerase sigma factor [Deltaproteobacteria bacterium]|nr:MAG: sigma-70 family RNA polymerase sigma factor [Deltaproteobacteria bacterium]
MAAGDAAAGVESVEVYGDLVWSLARRFSRSESDARDATQDIFRALWDAAPDYDPEDTREPLFVAMTARRLLLERRPAESTEPASYPPVERCAAGGDAAEPQLDDSEELAPVRHALAELPPERRRALELAVVGGYTHPQIARALDLPLETVQSHIRLGLLRVRAEMYAAEATASEPS